MNPSSFEKCVLIAVLRSESQSQRKFKIFQRYIKGEKENRNLKIQFIVVISRQLKKQNKQYKFDKQQKTNTIQKKTIPYKQRNTLSINKKDRIIILYTFLFL